MQLYNLGGTTNVVLTNTVKSMCREQDMTDDKTGYTQSRLHVFHYFKTTIIDSENSRDLETVH